MRRSSTAKDRLKPTWAPKPFASCLNSLDLVELSEQLARRAGRDRLEAESQRSDQPTEDRRSDPRQRQQAGVDGAGRDSGHPARPAAAGVAGLGQLRHQRPERPLPPDHQPQQPAEEAGRSERAGSDHPQRKADVAAVGRRAVRQQSLQAARAWAAAIGRSSR